MSWLAVEVMVVRRHFFEKCLKEVTFDKVLKKVKELAMWLAGESQAEGGTQHTDPTVEKLAMSWETERRPELVENPSGSRRGEPVTEGQVMQSLADHCQDLGLHSEQNRDLVGFGQEEHLCLT